MRYQLTILMNMKVDEYDIKHTEESSNAEASEEEAQSARPKALLSKLERARMRRNQPKTNDDLLT